MFLTLPYFDPSGKFNLYLRRQLPALLSHFERICLSVIPPTAELNSGFIDFLRSEGVLLAFPEGGTLHGEHSRAALKLAVENSAGQDRIFFGFLDRVLFALETRHRDAFLSDLKRFSSEQFVIFERSEAAWKTHPENNMQIEQMVSRICELMCGEPLDLEPCALLFSREAGRLILNHSSARTTEVWGEWILLAKLNHIPLTRVEVDWLSWKDPHFLDIDDAQLKRKRETSPEETIKRIQMNVPCMMMLTESRFAPILCRKADTP